MISGTAAFGFGRFESYTSMPVPSSFAGKLFVVPRNALLGHAYFVKNIGSDKALVRITAGSDVYDNS